MNLQIGYVSETRNLEVVKKELNKARLIGLDCETTGLDALTKKVRLIQLATVDQVLVLDMFKLPKAPVVEMLESLFSDEKVVKIFHNAKFDMKFLQTNLGIDMRGMRTMFDTYLASKIVKGGQPYTSSLENLTRDLLGITLDKTLQKSDWSGSIYKDQIVYSALDAACLIPLYRILSRAIVSNSLQKAARLEFEFVPALGQMELNGFHLDRERWIEVAEAGKENLYLLEQNLRHLVGPINLKSNPQMIKFLSELTGLNVTRRNKDTIKELIDTYEPRTGLFGEMPDYRPVLIKLLEFSEEEKLQNTYGYSFLEHIHKKTGRIHSDYKQNDTRTARLSSSNPNLQNLPALESVRACFTAPDGRKLVRYDYSQIELRILAQYTRDELFCRAFREGIDLHSLTAVEEFGVRLENVTSQMRQEMKPINFGIPYGLGSVGLAKRLGVSQDEARDRLRRYYSKHPAITGWHDGQREYFMKHDCVRTASGRLRALPDWRWGEDQEFFAVQASKNFPIQGTSADIIKLALTEIYREMPGVMTVNSVHDEIIIECDERDADEAARQMEELMVAAAREFVPDIEIRVDGGVADCWKK